METSLEIKDIGAR